MNVRSPNENLMIHFRWITPLLLSILTGMAGFMLQEMRDTKRAAIEYTNTMIQQSNRDIQGLRTDVRDVQTKVEKINTDVASIKTLLTRRLVNQ